MMTDALHPRHASRPSRVLPIALPIGLLVTVLGSLWALSETPAAIEAVLPPAPAIVAQLPGIALEGSVAADPCAEPMVIEALGAGDSETAIAGFGGGTAFRDAVVSENAPCISLSDPEHPWVVVNKARPLDPVDHVPGALAGVSVPTTTSSNSMREDTAAALDAMGAALRDAGAGALGVNNGYRSYDLQMRNYRGYVNSSGQAGADASSARPGHSEHQTGLAVDVVSCSGGCGGIEGFGGTQEAIWIAENAWRYGFIVRYEDGETAVTGYIPEPWHLRYIGPALAAAYHEGGYHSLEDFFGLPAAPDYDH